MALQPYDTASYGVDIAGIQFLTHSLTPTVQWRETRNMDPNDDMLEKSEGLGLENEGVVAVTVHYTFIPYFSNIFTGPFQMSEEAYVRGRKGTFVEKD